MKKSGGKIVITIICLIIVCIWAWMSGGNSPIGFSAAPIAPGTPTASLVADTGSPAELSLPAASLSAPLPDPTAEPAAVAQEPTAIAQELDPETGKDKYLTDAVPAGKPLPVEPENAAITDNAFTITLSVRCDTLLKNMTLLDKEKHELVPADGFIFPAASVVVYEGESVFNVLQREMKKARIHMEFVNTPVYNSAYIEGIHNLYEFDAGELSGWMYKVNDWFPNYGCSRYQLKSGDVVEWVYTCDLGRDVGEYWLGGGQNDGQRGGRSGQRDD